MFLYWFPIFIAPAFLFCFASDLAAVSRNPPPVFDTDYQLPPTPTPCPYFSTSTENTAALALYVLFLVIAGLAVHRWRSRKVLFCLSVCSVFVLGFFMRGCPCPVGMFQNLVQAAVDSTAVVTWTAVLLFVLPLFAALFFGRIFCSSVCPLGAIQELTTIKNVPLSNQLEHILGLFRYFWLGIGVFCVIVGFGYVACRLDPFVGFFRFGTLYPLLIFSIVVLGIGFFVGRPFCRFMCPYGALLSMCGSLAARKVSVTPGTCERCRLCERVCPYNAILPPSTEPTLQERRYGPWKLLGTIFALPVIVLVFAHIGGMAAPRLAALHHDVRTARLLYAEEEKWVATYGTFPETRGLVQIGTPSSEVYRRAVNTTRLFGLAGIGLGAWIGLVIGVKWISLSLRHRRTDYEVDPSRCFACGRCFWYCPNQKEHRLLLTPENRQENC
ncbi:MAG: 4Fe-4S binding protein [Planctomycetaceae bacterium]|nr:4Fe-4S binding protein [Planctomycetaceae bacterium]